MILDGREIEIKNCRIEYAYCSDVSKNGEISRNGEFLIRLDKFRLLQANRTEKTRGRICSVDVFFAYTFYADSTWIPVKRNYFPDETKMIKEMFNYDKKIIFPWDGDLDIHTVEEFLNWKPGMEELQSIVVIDRNKVGLFVDILEEVRQFDPNKTREIVTGFKRKRE